MKKESKFPYPKNIPTYVSGFIGREKELVAVKQLIKENRLVTLTGAGGSGKTRLALKIAHDLWEKFKERVWFVELASLTDPSLVPQKIASTLEIREQSNRPLLDSIVNYFSTRPSLLVLDNCEHLIEASAEITNTLLQKCADLKILATSREGLGIMGEVTWIVPPLSLPELQPWRDPDSARDSLNKYEKSESVQLFIVRATAISPEFKLTRNNGAWVAEICRRLDGMPLAIELAAARVRTLSVQEIAKRLDDRFNLLTSGSRTAPARHLTLAAIIEWSYTLLSEKEQKLLQRFSVFLGGGTLNAIESVCMGNDINKSEVLDTLSQLVDKSLVIANRRSGKNRYSLLETIREYALGKLSQSNELGTIQNHHLDFFLQFAEEAEQKIKGPEEFIWFERLEDEHDNLRVALSWAFESQNPEAGIRLTSGLFFFWFVRGYLLEGIDWLEKVLPRGQDVSPHLKADALKNLGSLLLWRDEKGYERSTKLLEESLTLYQQLGDDSGIAWVLNQLGLIAVGQNDFERAKQLLNESLTIRRRLGDPWNIAHTLQNFFLIAWHDNNLVAARKYTEETLDWFQQAGYQRGVVGTLADLGEIAHKEGDSERAINLLKYVLEQIFQFGDKWSVAINLESLAIISNDVGKPEKAAQLFGAADTIREMLGMPVREITYYEENIAAVQDNLDDEKFSQLWEKGREMSLEQVVEFALHEPESPAPARAKKERADGLTRREREAAILIAEGLSNRKIAEAMTVTEKTVEAYVTRILRKLGFDSRVQIATWVIDNNLN